MMGWWWTGGSWGCAAHPFRWMDVSFFFVPLGHVIYHLWHWLAWKMFLSRTAEGRNQTRPHATQSNNNGAQNDVLLEPELHFRLGRMQGTGKSSRRLWKRTRPPLRRPSIRQLQKLIADSCSLDLKMRPFSRSKFKQKFVLARTSPPGRTLGRYNFIKFIIKYFKVVICNFNKFGKLK